MVTLALKALKKHKQTLLYACSLSLCLLLLNWLKLQYLIFHNAIEIYAGAIALLFTGIGIWVAVKLMRPANIVTLVERPENFEQNSAAVKAMGLSKRELEVLEMIAKGYSNAEIADHLFVSVNTIKTHLYNAFEKMEVNSRTKAIEMARRIKLIA